MTFELLVLSKQMVVHKNSGERNWMQRSETYRQTDLN